MALEFIDSGRAATVILGGYDAAVAAGFPVEGQYVPKSPAAARTLVPARTPAASVPSTELPTP